MIVMIRYQDMVVDFLRVCAPTDKRVEPRDDVSVLGEVHDMI